MEAELSSVLDLGELLVPWELGHPTRVRPPACGTNNWTRLVDLPDRRVVVRVYQNLDGVQVTAEHVLVRALAGTGLPFAVPRPIPTADGRTWVRTERGPLAVFDWIDGERPEVSPPALHAVGRALGQLDIALAALPEALAPRDWRVPLSGTHPAAGTVAELIAELGPSTGADGLAAVFDALDGAYADLLERAPAQLVHQDMALSNVLVRAGRVTGILDFEIAGVDARVCDLVAALHQTGCLDSVNDPLARADALLDGYGQAVRLQPVEIAAVPGQLEFRAAGALVWRYGRYRAGHATLDEVRAHLTELHEVRSWRRRHGAVLAALIGERAG